MKTILLNLLKKDILLIEKLSIRSKKYIIYYIIIYLVLFFFFFYIEVIKVERFTIYIYLFIFYLNFKILMELFTYFLIDNNNLKNLIRGNNEIFNNLLKILLFIQK
jgi:hypothetical protein